MVDKNKVKQILSGLLDNGRIRPLKRDEHLPKFSFKQNNGTSGTVRYNGNDYVFAVVDDNIRVMTDTEAGWNWSETIYSDNFKESTIREEYDPYIIYRESGKYKGTPKSNFDATIKDATKIVDLSDFDSTKQIKDYFFKYGFIKNQDEIIIDKSARIQESYEELDGTKVLTYTNYNNAKKEAEKRGFKEAEYGDYYNSDLSYCIWTKSGTLDDDFRIEAYYKFDENGKTRPLTKSEAELDNMQHGHGKFEDSDELISEEWTQLARKSVQDSDGFYTDYTLWKNNITGKFECIFGDNELYTPENEYPDAEFETEEEAREWFDSYKGYEDDDLNENNEVGETMNKKYFKVVEKIGDGNYYTAYFINAEYPSDAEEIAKKHAERYGNELFGIELTTKLEVENGKRHGMSVIEECDTSNIKESVDGPDMSQLKSNIMEFPNGEYFYIEYDDGKLFAGGATNVGIFHDFSVDYDTDISLDANIRNLYDKIIDERPELLNIDEGCTSNKCDYTDDGKDDIVRKYEIKMNGEFLEYVTGTEQDIIDKINDYIFADRDDKMAFMIAALPTYTYEVVDEDEVVEDLKFDVNENFRIRESNHIVG